MSALTMLDAMIRDLESDLNLAPGDLPSTLQPTSASQKPTTKDSTKDAKKDTIKEDKKDDKNGGKGAKKQKQQKQPKAKPAELDLTLPAPCHIEFKVGVITKVWVHPDADKLWCEEIDCGEAEPRQISSGLRPHYTTEADMMGRRLLVVANLKAKNLKGFKSHGMVLCAAEEDDKGNEKVQFVEPPEGAPLGEVSTHFELLSCRGSALQPRINFLNRLFPTFLIVFSSYISSVLCIRRRRSFSSRAYQRLRRPVPRRWQKKNHIPCQKIH